MSQAATCAARFVTLRRPMKLPASKFVPLVAFAAAAIGTALYFAAAAWLPNRHSVVSAEPATSQPASAVDLENKLIVSEQAQKNLRLVAKTLKSETYWKSITVPGMIVDRPGVSDREVVAPAVGTVLQILHIPGDMVRPGEILFTLRLASESLHASQAGLYKTNHDITLAEARLKRLRAAGEGVAQVRTIEVESEIARLTTAASAYREDLLRRGLSQDEIDSISQGRLVNEVSVTVPEIAPAVLRRLKGLAENPADFKPDAVAFEVRQLAVEVGQQVEAGQTLCDLVNHKLLAIEGRAFRDEAAAPRAKRQRGLARGS